MSRSMKTTGREGSREAEGHGTRWTISSSASPRRAAKRRGREGALAAAIAVVPAVVYLVFGAQPSAVVQGLGLRPARPLAACESSVVAHEQGQSKGG